MGDTHANQPVLYYQSEGSHVQILCVLVHIVCSFDTLYGCPYDTSMRKTMPIFRLFTNLPIAQKLLLVSIIPILTLGVLSVVTYNSVRVFAQDEDRLNHVYHVQTMAAEYMRLVVDLETGFRGFVLTQEPKFLKPYHAAKQRVLQIGKSLEQMVETHEEQRSQIHKTQSLVQTLMEDKDRLIERAKQGHPEEALYYIESGTGR